MSITSPSTYKRLTMTRKTFVFCLKNIKCHNKKLNTFWKGNIRLVSKEKRRSIDESLRKWTIDTCLKNNCFRKRKYIINGGKCLNSSEYSGTLWIYWWGMFQFIELIFIYSFWRTFTTKTRFPIPNPWTSTRGRGGPRSHVSFSSIM